MTQASRDDLEEASPTSDKKRVYDYIDVKI